MCLKPIKFDYIQENFKQATKPVTVQNWLIHYNENMKVYLKFQKISVMLKIIICIDVLRLCTN